MWVEVIMFLFAGICAVCDGIRKEIPLPAVWAGILMAVVLRAVGAMEEESTWLQAVVSVVPGILFWGISLLTGEKVGYGDGWLLIMTGLYVGVRKCFLILFAGLVVQSVVVLVLLVIKKVSGEREIPFAPFLFLGMGVVICL